MLQQTFEDFVVEIFDNASTDRTEVVARSFSDPRVEYRRQSENVGLLGNHRSCLETRNTEYVHLLSDDDMLYPAFLERCVATLDEYPNVGFVHTGFDVVGSDGEFLEHGNWTYGLEISTVEDSSAFIHESMRWSCRVCPSTAVIRTQALPEHPLDENDYPAIDFGLWLRIAGRGWDVAFLSDSLAAYRVHASAHSAAQLGPPQSGGYLPALQTVALLRSVKLRFLAGHGAEMNEQHCLALTDRCARWETATIIKKETIDRRGMPLRRLRFLIRACLVEPRMLADPDVWQILAADIAGVRGRAIVRLLRSRTKSAPTTEAIGR